ncbi:tetratricopeptide repeat protein [Streptomyces sp. NPDC002276]
MRSASTPNQDLRSLLGQAGWSGARLAREVNALGAEQGTALHYDRTSVAHWLAGSRPRPPVPALVAEALSRHLGRPVRPQDTGLTARGQDPDDLPGAPPGEGSGVDRLDHLLRLTDRRTAALLGAYSLGALAAPHWPSSPVRGPVAPRSGTRPAIGMAHVESARELLDVLARGDAVFGAGRIRQPLRRYLATAVLPWLKTDVKPAVRRELFSVAARLTYLCAFAHFDTNHQAAAQHFYLTSAELAREAGDRVGYALALRGLSVQAHALEHHAAAHRLAEQAVRVGIRHAPQHQQAFLLGQLAVTGAALGDRGHVRHLVRAEKCLDSAAGGTTSPVGSFHPGSLALQHAAAARSQGRHQAAVEALGRALRHRPADERRSHAVCLAELAETQLTIGHLDQACHTWHTFLDLYPHISSARADDRLRALTARLRPHTVNQSAALLIARARETRRKQKAAGVSRGDH